MTHEAVIVDVVRSPMGRGKPGGALSSVHPSDLLGQVLGELIRRNEVDPATVDDVLIGCVSQVSEQSATPGRQAWLAAGLPMSVPSTTIERKCGSGQQAVDFAVQGVMAGAYDIAVAGGVESMSRVPMGSARGDGDPFGPAVRARFSSGLVSQGVAAELLAARYSMSREELDELGAASQERAHRAATAGHFKADMVGIALDDGSVVTEDETIRPGTDTATLAGLRPAFASDENRASHPDIDWKITAGTSSQISDGAAGVLVMSAERAGALGLRPRARVVASAVVGDDPVLMLAGPIPATRKVLDRAGMSLEDIDVVEVNEAFASVPLAWQREYRFDPEKLNPWGGAIALGHPLGASGCRLLGSMLGHLEHTGGRFGLQTMCEAGGMANAFIIERLS